jgi:hypothetical protein
VTTGVRSGTDWTDGIIGFMIASCSYHRHIMEAEQIMARLPAEIRTGQEHMKDLLARMEAKMDGRQEEMKAEMGSLAYRNRCQPRR